jgi:ACS family tartrate transporter-like MFS transporter
MSQSPDLTTTALRKAAWRLIPLIAVGYGIAYMDRVNVSYAALQMNRDLHFSNTIYGIGAGIFFLSYAVCEIPSNLLLYRFGARRWLSRIMITWGVIAMAMIFVRTPLEYYAARFLLGIAEAGFFPGIVFYIFQWFPAQMRARSITGFYIAFPISTIVMGSIAGALMSLDGRKGLAGWQWLFLIEALPAVLLGVVFLLMLPDGPADAEWLSDSERAAIVSAVQEEPASPGAAHHSIGPAFRDPRVWLIGLFFMCVQAGNYAYGFSAPQIVERITGSDVSRVGYLLAGFGVIGTGMMLLAGWLSDRSSRRHAHVLPWTILMLVGFVGCGLSSAPAVALPSLALVFASYCAMQGPLWAIPGAFLSGRSAAAGIAGINMIGILGGWLGPSWMGFARDLTGDFQRGLLMMTIPLLIAAGIMLYLLLTERRKEGCTAQGNPVASLS